MRARARVCAALGPDGRSRLVTLDGEPPLVPRATGPARVHLVGAAAGPMPGDRTCLELDVAPRACLVVVSTAATIALPGADPVLPPSVADVRARVGEGGLLVVLGRPLVAVRGSRHSLDARVDLDAGARLVWRDLLVPGRTGEPPGEVSSRLRVTLRGAPLLDTEVGVGPGPRGLGAARCAGTLALLGWPAPPASVAYGHDAVVTPLAVADGVVGTALGPAHEVDAALRRMAADLLPPAVGLPVLEAW